MREAGYGNDVRLDFDLAVRELKRWADGRRDETVMQDAPRHSAHERPKVAVPKYRTLGEILDADDEDEPDGPAFSAADLEDIARDVWAGLYRDEE